MSDGKSMVEAALFSADSELRAIQIAERTGLVESDVRCSLMDLRREYDCRGSAIMIAKIGNSFRMMLRPEYTKYAPGFISAELPGGVMRTLSTIAYNQPVLQSKLSDVRGGRVYNDVRILKERGFVSSKKIGQTCELTTSSKFSEYFGIGSTRKNDIRKWIETHAKNMDAACKEEKNINRTKHDKV